MYIFKCTEMRNVYCKILVSKPTQFWFIQCTLECSLADTSTVFVGIAGSVRVRVYRVSSKLAFLTADIFASFGVLPLLHLRAYTLQDATVYTCSYLYSGNFIISTVKSRYSHCFNCLKLFNEDRQYPKNGGFWP